MVPTDMAVRWAGSDGGQRWRAGGSVRGGQCAGRAAMAGGRRRQWLNDGLVARLLVCCPWANEVPLANNPQNASVKMHSQNAFAQCDWVVLGLIGYKLCVTSLWAHLLEI